jgi:hypothetical protein
MVTRRSRGKGDGSSAWVCERRRRSQTQPEIRSFTVARRVRVLTNLRIARIFAEIVKTVFINMEIARIGSPGLQS